MRGFKTRYRLEVCCHKALKITEEENKCELGKLPSLIQKEKANQKNIAVSLFVKYNNVESLKEKTDILIEKITWQWWLEP